MVHHDTLFIFFYLSVNDTVHLTIARGHPVFIIYRDNQKSRMYFVNRAFSLPVHLRVGGLMIILRSLFKI